MRLSLKRGEAEALLRGLDAHGGDPQLDAVKQKLDRHLNPVPELIEGQFSIDDYLGGEDAEAGQAPKAA